MKFGSSKITWVIALILIVLIALGLREYALQHLVADFDEPDYINFSLDYAQLIRSGDIKGVVWYDENIEHPAFVKILYAFVLNSQPPIEHLYSKDFDMLKPIGEDAKPYVNSVRRTSAFFGVFTVLAASLLNPIAGLFLALQSTAVHYTSVYYFDAAAAFFASMSMFAYILWRRKKSLGMIPPTFQFKTDFWLLMSAVCLGLTAASKYVYALVGIVILVDTILDAIKTKTSIKQVFIYLGAWGLISVLVFYVVNPMIWPKPVGRLVESLQFHFHYTQSESVSRYNYPFWQPLKWLFGAESRYRPALLINLDYIVLLFAIIGLPQLFKKSRAVFFWLLLGLFFLLIWNTKWPQYIMTIVTPLCFSAAYGFQVFFLKTKSSLHGFFSQK